MYKNDVDEALLGLSEKELLIAVLKSQAEIYRLLAFSEEIGVTLQRELISDQEKRTNYRTKGKLGDAMRRVFTCIEGASQPGNSDLDDQESLNQHLLDAVDELRIERKYATDKG